MEVVENGREATMGVETGTGQPWGRNWDWEYRLRKYLLLLATLVVTVTYAAGFNPPGGVWQDTRDGRLAGDPIIRATHYHWLLAFYYCNATAFAASLVVIVLILVLAIQHDKEKEKDKEKENEKKRGKKVFGLLVLRFVMGLDLLSLMSAYGAGTYRDVLSAHCRLVLHGVGGHCLGLRRGSQLPRSWQEVRVRLRQGQRQRTALQNPDASRDLRGERHVRRRA